MRIIFNTLFSQYKWPSIPKIGKAPIEIYLAKLNPKQTSVTEDHQFKRIHWEDEQTCYVIRFSKNGEFICIERETWFEYTLPFFQRKIILDEKYAC